MPIMSELLHGMVHGFKPMTSESHTYFNTHNNGQRASRAELGVSHLSYLQLALTHRYHSKIVCKDSLQIDLISKYNEIGDSTL